MKEKGLLFLLQILENVTNHFLPSRKMSKYNKNLLEGKEIQIANTEKYAHIH